MRRYAIGIGIALAVFSPLFFAAPAHADWVGTNANINNGIVQFDYRGGTATQTLVVPEDAVSAYVSIDINNTISNKIGWNGAVADTWSVSINGNLFSGNEITTTSVRAPVTGDVVITISGIDRGFWAGWYGPIFSNLTLTYELPVVEVPLTESVRPEPTPEALPEPSPEPLPAPTPTSTPEPPPAPAAQPEPTNTPAPAIEPTPAPEPPAPAPAPEPEPQPAPAPVAPIPVEVVKPAPAPAPLPPVEPSVAPEAPPLPAPAPASVANVDPATLNPTELSAAQVDQLTAAAITTLATAEQGSPAYEQALEQLLVVAQADDAELPEQLAAIPVLGDVAGAVLDAFNSLGNIGADMSPKQREQAKKEVVATIAIGQAVMSAGLVSSASYKRGV